MTPYSCGKQAQALRVCHVTRVWICIDQHQQRYILPGFRKAVCHFQCHQAAEGIADQNVGSLRIQLLECLEIEPGHILNPLQRLLYLVQSLSLNSVNWVARSNVLCKLSKLHGTAEAMCNENRGFVTASLKMDKGRRPARSGLL